MVAHVTSRRTRFQRPPNWFSEKLKRQPTNTATSTPQDRADGGHEEELELAGCMHAAHEEAAAGLRLRTAGRPLRRDSIVEGSIRHVGAP
jgi:hypothetical protein